MSSLEAFLWHPSAAIRKTHFVLTCFMGYYLRGRFFPIDFGLHNFLRVSRPLQLADLAQAHGDSDEEGRHVGYADELEAQFYDAMFYKLSTNLSRLMVKPSK